MTQERVLLAIDSENVYRCARNVSRYIDYEALISLVAAYGTPVGAWIYVARPTYIDRWSGFLVKLKFLGFDRIVVRNSHERSIGVYKSDIDMIMAMDIAEAARDDIFDRLVLVTGDSDFVAVVRTSAVTKQSRYRHRAGRRHRLGNDCGCECFYQLLRSARIADRTLL